MLAGYAVALTISSAFLVWYKGDPNYAREFFAGIFVVCLVTIVPWLACVLMGNAYSIRNPIYYAAWAIAPVAVIAAFSGNPVAILTGYRGFIPVGKIALLAGLAYWAIAGRFAGVGLATQPTPDASKPPA
jgi:hypothetical protein